MINIIDIFNKFLENVGIAGRLVENRFKTPGPLSSCVVYHSDLYFYNDLSGKNYVIKRFKINSVGRNDDKAWKQIEEDTLEYLITDRDNIIKNGIQ